MWSISGEGRRRVQPALRPVFLVVSLSCLAARVAAAGTTIGPMGPVITAPQTSTVLLNGLSYRATSGGITIFETGSATSSPDGTLTFALTGPGASGASVRARVTPTANGVILDWTITTNHAGPWTGWNTGFTLQLPQPRTAARTSNVIAWRTPTGAHSWENPGDTPYPDTEFQVRQVDTGGWTLAWVSSHYDGDWIYAGDLNRTPFSSFMPRAGGGTTTLRTAFFVVDAAHRDPAALAAEAAGRPLGLKLATPKVGNLYAPGEEIALAATVFNVSAQPVQGTVSVQVWDYTGSKIVDRTETATFQPQTSQVFSLPVTPLRRGVLFVTGSVNWGDGSAQNRTTLGVLPVRPATPTLPNSMFGLSSAPARPTVYPDQVELGTMLDVMQRIGARRVRWDWYHLIDNNPALQCTVNPVCVNGEIAQLASRGILPYHHLTAPAGTYDPIQSPFQFRQALQSGLNTFGAITSHMEIGNEVNLHGMNAATYVSSYLTPITQVTRATAPGTRIASMGFGGFHYPWIADFEAAGGMALIDVLSIHPGSFPSAPEHWTGFRGWTFRSQVQDALDMAGRHGNKDVWITEAYAPTLPDPAQVDLRTSADYLVRMHVSAIALGVKHLMWYTISDGTWSAQRQCANDVECNFGIMYSDLTPKPAYLAYGTMTEHLEGAAVQGRLNLSDDELYGVRFTTNAGAVDVLWSYREKHETDRVPAANRLPGEPWVPRWHAPATVTLPASGPVTVTDIMGNVVQMTPLNGAVTLSLTGSPVYVRGLGSVPLVNRFWNAIPANGAWCTFTMPAWTASVPAAASSGSYSLTPGPSDCGVWPQISASWITATTNGTLINYAVEANPTSGARSGTISFAGYVFTITQAAGPAGNPPTISMHPSNQTIAYGAMAALDVAASGNGLTYQWYRGERGDTLRPIGGATSSALTPSLIGNVRVWVRVSNQFGTADSNAATVTVAFSDSPVAAGTIPIRAVHFNQLRARIDALRLFYGGRSPYPYSRSIATGGIVRAADVLEMRSALSQAHADAGLPLPIFTTSPTVGGMIRAADISDLQQRVQAIER